MAGLTVRGRLSLPPSPWPVGWRPINKPCGGGEVVVGDEPSDECSSRLRYVWLKAQSRSSASKHCPLVFIPCSASAILNNAGIHERKMVPAACLVGPVRLGFRQPAPPYPKPRWASNDEEFIGRSFR